MITADSSAAFSGAVNVTGGTLRISGAGAKAGTGTIALGNKVLDIHGGATVTNDITVASGAAITSSGSGVAPVMFSDGAPWSIRRPASRRERRVAVRPPGPRPDSHRVRGP